MYNVNQHFMEAIPISHTCYMVTFAWRDTTRRQVPRSSPWLSAGSSPQCYPSPLACTPSPVLSDLACVHDPWPAGPLWGSSHCHRKWPATHTHTYMIRALRVCVSTYKTSKPANVIHCWLSCTCIQCIVGMYTHVYVHAYMYVLLLTVSAAVRLIPSPPALVLSRNTNMSDLRWNTYTCICMNTQTEKWAA